MLDKMQKIRQNLKKKGKGFTLVELIVVIIIIAILVAVAIPAVTSFQDNARKSRIQSEHRELVSAIQSYIGAQDDPSNPGEITLDKIAPYMSKNAKQESNIESALATNQTTSNGKTSSTCAHEITNGVLTSTFIPSGVTASNNTNSQSSNSRIKTWVYDWKSTTSSSGSGASSASSNSRP